MFFLHIYRFFFFSFSMYLSSKKTWFWCLFVSFFDEKQLMYFKKTILTKRNFENCANIVLLNCFSRSVASIRSSVSSKSEIGDSPQTSGSTTPVASEMASRSPSSVSMITAIMPPPATPSSVISNVSSNVSSNRPAVVQDHVLYFINRQISISRKKWKNFFFREIIIHIFYRVHYRHFFESTTLRRFWSLTWLLFKKFSYYQKCSKFWSDIGHFRKKNNSRIS